MRAKNKNKSPSAQREGAASEESGFASSERSERKKRFRFFPLKGRPKKQKQTRTVVINVLKEDTKER